MLGLALSTAEVAESVQTELIDGGGCEYDIISQYYRCYIYGQQMHINKNIINLNINKNV